MPDHQEASDASDLLPPPDMLAAALAYAERKYFMVPLHSIKNGRCTCNRGRDCRRPGKHPVGFLASNGSKQASAYPAQIERWFKRVPWANIGIVTGPSRLVVLDVDHRNGGTDSFQRLVEAHGPLPATLTAITGSADAKSRHYIFTDYDDEIVGSKGDGGEGVYEGLEILARGNYFVAAPSLHISGRRYSLIAPEAIAVPAPTWMKDGLR